jgi:membrane-associated protein
MDMLFSSSNLLDHVTTLGYLGVAFFIFAESGLFFGFFLPGDSLLFTAGLLASTGLFSMYILVPMVAFSAIIGDSVGYFFGKKVGPALFKKEDSFFFRKSHVERTQIFYERHGPKALILGRFIPIVRTFVPILAGVGNMRYDIFIRFNIVGGLLWAVGLPLIGYVLGNRIPNIDTYLLPIVVAIILISFVPVLIELLRAKKNT